LLLCSRFKTLESELEASLKRSLQIKDDKMAALDARLQESCSLNLQLRQDLKAVSPIHSLTHSLTYHHSWTEGSTVRHLTFDLLLHS